MGKEIVYISDENMEFWKSFKELAKQEKRGVGFFMCDILRKNVKFPEKKVNIFDNFKD